MRPPLPPRRARRRFRRSGRSVAVGLLAAIVVAPTLRADPLPTIVTFELSKARKQAREIARDPRKFWVGEIVAWIEARKPHLNMHLKAPRAVDVSFVVGHDGRLVSTAISKSSGDPAVDMQAIAMLSRSAPFPPMPAGLAEQQMAFTLPLRFN